MKHVLLLAVYGLLSVSLFVVFHTWRSFLVRLAEQHDVPTRLKIAARWYRFLVAPGLAALMGGTIILTVLAVPEARMPEIPIMFLCAAVPPLIWWFRRMTALYSLGYGRRSSHNT
jgi:hypothetical protein